MDSVFCIDLFLLQGLPWSRPSLCYQERPDPGAELVQGTELVPPEEEASEAHVDPGALLALSEGCFWSTLLMLGCS